MVRCFFCIEFRILNDEMHKKCVVSFKKDWRHGDMVLICIDNKPNMQLQSDGQWLSLIIFTQKKRDSKLSLFGVLPFVLSGYRSRTILLGRLLKIHGGLCV